MLHNLPVNNRVYIVHIVLFYNDTVIAKLNHQELTFIFGNAEKPCMFFITNAIVQNDIFQDHKLAIRHGTEEIKIIAAQIFNKNTILGYLGCGAHPK